VGGGRGEESWVDPWEVALDSELPAREMEQISRTLKGEVIGTPEQKSAYLLIGCGRQPIIEARILITVDARCQKNAAGRT